MEPSYATTLPPLNQGIDGLGIDAIGIAFTYLEGVGSMCFQTVFLSLLQQELKSACLSGTEIGGLLHPYYSLFTVQVPCWRRACPILESLSRRIKLIDFAEIAYWDRAELIWRTVHGSSGLSFDRFFSPENLAMVAEHTERRNAFIDTLIRLSKEQREKQSGTQQIGS